MLPVARDDADGTWIQHKVPWRNLEFGARLHRTTKTEQPDKELGPDESQEARSQEEARSLLRGRSVFADVDDEDKDGVLAAKALAKTLEKKIGWVDRPVRGRDMHFHAGTQMMLHVPATQEAIGAVVAELAHRAGEGRR